jgi:hypothetical protein
MSTNIPFNFAKIDIQPKLKVSQPDDIYEQEADRVADQVMRMPLYESSISSESEETKLNNDNSTACNSESGTRKVKFSMRSKHKAEDNIKQSEYSDSMENSCPLESIRGLSEYASRQSDEIQTKPVAGTIQRQTTKKEVEDELIRAFLRSSENIQRKVSEPSNTEDEDEEEKLMQTRPAVACQAAPPTDSKFDDEIKSLEGRGQPLPISLRHFLEPHFGHDFSQVRVHTDSKAAEIARVVNARAFTIGRNVVFGDGEYAPGTSNGKRLLAHELTHVVQQSQGLSRLQRRILIGGSPYTPTFKYYAYLIRTFGPAMKEFVEHMHNGGLPPDYIFSNYEQLGFEVRIRGQAIKGMEEVHKGCCDYFDSAHPPHLDSTYWNNVGFLDFRPKSPLPPGKNASDAIEAIFAPGANTRIECLSMIVAIEYYSMLKGIGKDKFNVMFPGGAGIRISTVSSGIPLVSPGASGKYDVISLATKIELLPGDWVYFKNFSDYLTKHPGGAWQGENAIYLGGGMYRGFGVPALNEDDMNKELVRQYNFGLPPSDQKTAVDLIAGGGGLLLNPVIRPKISKIVP